MLLRAASRRTRTALLLGLGAAAALHLPPFDLAERIDGKLFDLWSHTAAPTAPDDVVVVRLDDPAWLATLADLAQRNEARLLVSTTPQPPPSPLDELVLGPTELVIGNQLIRRTQWRNGGHLWFDAHVDGVVRKDTARLGEDDIPSLAYAAAAALASGAASSATWEPAPTGTLLPESRGSRMRFFRAGTFEAWTPKDVLAAPKRLAGIVVVAGRSSAAYATPIGLLSAPELVAHAVAGYRDGRSIDSSAAGAWIGWALALATVAAFAAVPRPRAARLKLALPAAGAAGIVGANAFAFFAASTWLPAASPLAFVIVAGSVLFANRRRIGRRRDRAIELEEGRQAVARGDLDAAWRAYRDVPPTSALLDELYALGAALDADGRHEQAADVYHRAALVDARFRDVTRRLVAAARAEPTDHVRAPAMRGAELTALDRYEILEPIGRGSTGSVFLGRDPKISRLLAIKVIDLAAEYETSEQLEAGERFRREAETAGRLNHPNIVTIFDIGEVDRLAYIAMEYLKGRLLGDFTKPGNLLPPRLVLELAAQTADALHYAHGQNVVHRDIKPANIMYDSVSGVLKITDFGIARLIDVSRTRTGIVLGTPSFMAPEQLEGRNVNGHTDLFALGVSLYQLLTGRLPFRGASMTKLMFVIANEPHQPITSVRSDLPVQLDTLIDTALAKDPANRFQSGAEMAGALRLIAGQFA